MNTLRWGRHSQGGLLLLVLLLASPQSLPAEENKSALAVINGRNITEADLTSANNGQLARSMNNQIYLARKQALDSFITDQLLEQEAKKRGLSREQLLQQEVNAKVSATTDAEVEQWYNANKARVGNKPLAEIKSQIASQLQNQKLQQRQQTFVRSLRKAAGVKILITPPPLNVALDGAPVRGSTTAPVTIVEFSDFQCPFCARVQPELVKVRETYKDQVKIVFKDFPLDNIHPNARKAAEASRCAGEQGKYWEYHDVLFANNDALGVPNLKKFAADLKMDPTQFNTCLDSGKYAAAVTKDTAEGAQAGVSGTPAFFINSRPISGAQPFASFQDLIDEALEAR